MIPVETEALGTVIKGFIKRLEDSEIRASGDHPNDNIMIGQKLRRILDT